MIFFCNYLFSHYMNLGIVLNHQCIMALVENNLFWMVHQKIRVVIASSRYRNKQCVLKLSNGF